jgi:hypothetical protein
MLVLVGLWLSLLLKKVAYELSRSEICNNLYKWLSHYQTEFQQKHHFFGSRRLTLDCRVRVVEVSNWITF